MMKLTLATLLILCSPGLADAKKIKTTRGKKTPDIATCIYQGELFIISLDVRWTI